MVPTQIVFSNSLCFSCLFPVQPQIFPVPIYMICNYNIHKTDVSSLKKNYLLPLESGNLQLEQTKFPVFWQNFQIPCVFLDREFSFTIFPVSPVQWVPCLWNSTCLKKSRAAISMVSPYLSHRLNKSNLVLIVI